MRRPPALLLCLAVVAGCGSTETASTKKAKAAAIAAALREVEAQIRSADQKLRVHPGGTVGLQVFGAPPKGVSKAEWEAAIREAQPRLRAVANGASLDREIERIRHFRDELDTRGGVTLVYEPPKTSAK
jgi:hypothetical protein